MPDPRAHPNRRHVEPDICAGTVEPRTRGREEVASEFRYFARHRAGTYAPLYARLAAAIAESSELLDLAMLARPGQSRPDLLLALIHDLLLRHPDHLAARFYPSLSIHPVDGDPVPAVSQLVQTHRDELAAAMRHRLVQTNEVGRCSFLAPAIRTAAHHASTQASGKDDPDHDHPPLALLEIGASAGLNLLLDRYGYRYRLDPSHVPSQARSTPTTIELPGKPIVECSLDGPGVPPVHPLPITWRAGIDLNPLDINDPDDRRWLRALIWPDHRGRAALLDSALQTATRTRPWPAVHAGDAAQLLGPVAATAPTRAHLVIYHSAVLAHMDLQARVRFTAAVLTLSTQRPLSWVQAEPRLDHDPRRLRLTECRDGRVAAEHTLGAYQPHGQWLCWG